MDGKGLSLPISGLRVSSTDLETITADASGRAQRTLGARVALGGGSPSVHRRDRGQEGCWDAPRRSLEQESLYRDREWLGSCGAETLAEIRKITGGGADFALEESAGPAVFRLAVDVLRGLGTCILVGNARAGTEVSFAAGRPDCARRDIA